MVRGELDIENGWAKAAALYPVRRLGQPREILRDVELDVYEFNGKVFWLRKRCPKQMRGRAVYEDSRIL